MKKRETYDLVLILIWPIIATIISFLLSVNAFGSVILFLAIPSIYLSIRGKKYVKKSFFFSIVVSIPAIIVIDYIAHITETWSIPDTIFPFRLFDLVTLEVILWAFFMIYYIVIFYEYFLDKHIKIKSWKPRMWYLASIVIIIFVLFLLFLLNSPESLQIPYFYLVFGTIGILTPIILQLIKKTKIFSKFFLAAAYFFFLTLLYEITGLKLGWWTFPGTEFIGWILIFGVRFPFEEFFFWIMLLAMAVLSYFEFFDDDGK